MGKDTGISFTSHAADSEAVDRTKKLRLIKMYKEQAQLQAEADRQGCLSSTDVWTWDNQPHGDSIQS